MKTENSILLFSVFTPQAEFEFSGIFVNLLTSWSPPVWLVPSKVSLSNLFSVTSPSSFFFLSPRALSSHWPREREQDQKRKGTPANRTEPRPETRDQFSPVPPPLANDPEKENHKTMIAGAGSTQFPQHHQSQSLETPRPWSPKLGFDSVAVILLPVLSFIFILMNGFWFCHGWWMGFVDGWWILFWFWWMVFDFVNG